MSVLEKLSIVYEIMVLIQLPEFSEQYLFTNKLHSGLERNQSIVTLRMKFKLDIKSIGKGEVTIFVD